MNQIAIDVTAIRQGESGSAVTRATVTPVLNKNIGTATSRDDISASLKYENIFDAQGSSESTSLLAERKVLVDRYEPPLNETNVEEFDSTVDVNEHRITLLARKYATKHMLPEDAARLDILTQRFRNAMPGITEKDSEIMEGLNKQLNSATELSNRLQEKYK